MAIDPSLMGGAFGTTVPSINPTALSLSGNIFVQTPNLQVTVAGNPVQATLLGATITYGFDIGISTATVEFTAANFAIGGAPTDPTNTLDGLDYFQDVVISAGGTPNSPNYNAVRFTGLVIRIEATMWPSVFQMVCKGYLYLATQYYESTIFVGSPAAQLVGAGFPVGTPLVDFDDGQGSLLPGLINGQLCIDTTDENIVRAILGKVDGLNFDPNNIQGTGKVVCLSYFDATWPPYRSAWDMIQVFDHAFLGYRTFENLAGTIQRRQIRGYPSGDAQKQFVEGLNIWESEGTRTVEQLINASYVEGMSSIVGTSLGSVQLIFAYVRNDNNYQSAPVVEQFRDPFIEDSTWLTDPDGTNNTLHCEEVAAWRLSERNRELVNVTLTTYVDDPIAAGFTITVNSPHSAVTEPIWVQRVEVRVQANPPLFQQTIYGLGGGVAGDSGSPAPDSVSPLVFTYG